MSKRVLLVMLVACAFCASALAQEPPTPARVGSPGVVQPRSLREVIPQYPKLAQSARVQGRVIVEVTIDAMGRVSGAKITQSNPLLDVAAFNAVRQWEFAAPVVDGQARPVVTTVTIDFKLYNAAAPPPSATPAVSSPGMPPDFVVFYKEACSSPMTLTSSTHDLDSIYRALSAAGLLSVNTGLTRWQEPPPAHATVLADRIEIAVAGAVPVVDCPQDGGSSWLSFHLIVRASATWTQLWPPPARSEFQTAEYAQRLSAVRALVQKAIAGK